MLELHSASAGSGKTYTLAKKYIWYLLTITPEESPRVARLRTEAELADSSRHILAMTFTNKATAEMQQRILLRLFELANKPASLVCEGKDMRIKGPDYLEDFVKELHRAVSIADIAAPMDTAARVASLSGKALTFLLENYSDFKVSTIDSFFQLVLRTLAYETDHNDSYQVELDSEFLSQMAVDGTLEEVDANSRDTDTPYWIRKLIDRSGKGWNIFQRKLSSGFGPSPYRDFVKSVGRLENEDYKLHRKIVEHYLASKPDLRAMYETLEDYFESPVKELAVSLAEAASEVLGCLPQEMLQPGVRSVDVKGLVSRLRALQEGRMPSTAKEIREFPVHICPERLEKNSISKILVQSGAEVSEINRNMCRCADCLRKYLDMTQRTDYRLWHIYAENIPYFALFDITGRKRSEYLEETGSVELSETAYILHDIIDESDTPFVYERLGSTLDHFLIDEFQDTSRLQWENMRPLLQESLSRANDNLIIGDAKQSIYRFRNADPSIITTKVPRDFSRDIILRGAAPGENTNFRSALRVVQFNNSFFEYAARRVDAVSRMRQRDCIDFRQLYANVVQQPHKTKAAGYVEVSVTDDSNELFVERSLQRLPQLVQDMLRRGYSQRDICILVATNAEAEAVVKAFAESRLPDHVKGQEVRVESEQSLKVDSSHAVRTIVSVLESMAKGLAPGQEENDSDSVRKNTYWTDVATAFKLFELQSDAPTMADKLEAFLDAGADADAVTRVLDRMPSLSIPALVEGVTACFLSEEMRRTDAAYIAAFQDQVLEYCERRSTDIGSFLKWWDRRRRTASITPAKDSDAVHVMTIHKSKGLEFDCVVLPFVNWDMDDSKGSSSRSEWRWVEPAFEEDVPVDMPPLLPVNTSGALEGTPHDNLLSEYFDMVRMDTLNKAYVGFTRASKELYLFARATSKLSKSTKSGKDDCDSAAPGYSSIGNLIADFMQVDIDDCGCADMARLMPSLPVVTRCSETREEPGRKNVKKVEVTTINAIIGTKEELEHCPVLKEDDCDSDSLPIDSYEAVMPQENMLVYREEGDIADEDDPDPRSEGNIKHAVLENVKVTDDLPLAVRKLVLQGLLSKRNADRVECELHDKLMSESVRGWFDGSGTVYTERSLLGCRAVKLMRPDRVIAYPDGHAEVVDYKFGAVDVTGRHRRQVAAYVKALQASGRFSRVVGYIWYVNQGNIIPIAGDDHNLFS